MRGRTHLRLCRSRTPLTHPTERKLTPFSGRKRTYPLTPLRKEKKSLRRRPLLRSSLLPPRTRRKRRNTYRRRCEARKSFRTRSPELRCIFRRVRLRYIRQNKRAVRQTLVLRLPFSHPLCLPLSCPFRRIKALKFCRFPDNLPPAT